MQTAPRTLIGLHSVLIIINMDSPINLANGDGNMVRHRYTHLPMPAGTLCAILLMLSIQPLNAGEISVKIEDKKQRSVRNTVVELVGAGHPGMPGQNLEIAQQDGEFDPVFSLIPHGSSVLFTNRDPYQHHVYSVSDGNEFELPLYRDTPARRILFDTPGVVKMGCNIHDWMLAFGYVSESGHVVITDASGEAKFTDLPEGEYQLRIWNPRFKNNNKIVSQSFSLKSEQALRHTVEVSLRKKIRKPRRNNNNAYSQYSGQSQN